MTNLSSYKFNKVPTSVLFVDIYGEEGYHLPIDDFHMSKCIKPITNKYMIATSPFSARIIKEKLKMVGLRDIEKLKPAELSGGMKKRVGLARAIAVEPEIILYDEPTTGLDPITADAINDLIINTQKKLNATSVIVTHDMVSAYKIADRIAMIYNGEIIFSGTPNEVKKSNNPYVKQFINGESEGPIPI